MKSLALRTFGPAVIGRFDYVFRPSLRATWGGPMNGQLGRQRMCREIIAAVQPSAIVETGAYRGTTTAFLASFGPPVYTVELNPQYHAYAALRLRKLCNVRLTLGDSRTFLRELARDPAVPKDCVFFYLDAHWDEDLPLAREIETILEFWSRPVTMIDDFAVPGDDGYRYDDYGPGKALDAHYLARLGRSDFALFYPSLRAHEESGARRGCVVLCKADATRERLAALASLRAA